MDGGGVAGGGGNAMEVDKKEEIASESSEEQVVNPWEVSAKDGGKIDYDKLIDQFGCQRLDESLIDRVERLTSRQPHVFLRRGVFFAHRQNVHRFTESCFTVATYRKTYSQTIHPIPDKSLWREMSEGDPDVGRAGLDVVINPPKSLRPAGRPRKRRARAEDRGRVKRVVHCSRCNQTGHFRTTCAAPI
ncbi:hypothetical protein F2Q68_00033211 [Brassica cretica]|uniref:Tryptophanyl-tRNA synthetase n=1 Tax=Brassica cretica TaxID=69181 RepID=A0A8S9G6C9_BRACR|nr:hypothetical protein F2Q68_00033211 [Brassica cretica]